MHKARPGSQARVHLTEARNRRGWSQQEVADQLGTTYVNVSRWERGITRPSPYFRKKLCVLYGKTEQELELGQENEMQPGANEQALASANQASPAAFAATTLQTTPLSPVSANVLYDPSIPVPPQIPLVGRDEELTRLRQRLRGGGSVALTALNGLPGVGKTALSITLAHDPALRSHFKDGMLWAGLGPEPNMQSHLSRWGTLLGLSSSEMSTLNGSEAWAVALHRIIGSRTMLLVIDDAWTLEDALILKVGGPNCAHLVSTRFPYIATQIAAEGATAIKELNSDEGMVLLRMLAPKVVESEMQRSRELVMAVGGLPLALNLIGNYLRLQSYTGPARRVTAALQKLSEAGERLNISEPRGPVERHPSLPGDTPVSLRTVIAVTDQQLSEDTRRALHALAVFPPRPNSFSEEAALAIAACNTDTLDEINNTGLLEINGSDRYSLHQTIADYARLQINDYSAHQRLIAYISAFTETHRKDYEILESESSNILAALEAAVEQAHYAELTRIAVAFAPFLLARSLYEVADIHLQRAYNVAMAQQDHYGLSSVLLYLGEMARKRGNYEQAEKYLREGLEYARGVDDHERICEILAELGAVSWRAGNYQQAEVYAQEGLLLARQLGNVARIARLLDSLGTITMRQGNYAKSEEYLQEGLNLARQADERALTCNILINLGVQAADQGNYAQAEIHEKEALVLARQLGNNGSVSLLLNNLGDAASEQGNYSQAEAYFEEGLELARDIDMQEWVSVLLTNLASIARKQKHYDIAEHGFQESLDLAQQINAPLLTAHVLYEYGNLHLDRQQWEQAEKIFRKVLDAAPEGSQDMLGLAHYGLARTLAALGKKEEALQLGKASIQTLEMIGHHVAHEVKTWLDVIEHE